jgi:predicted hydrocarbon binding protein
MMTYQNTLSNLSNKMWSIFFQGMEEIIGQQGVNAALDSAALGHLVNNYPPYNHALTLHTDELSHVQIALERLYGLQGSQGLALRSGRACFKYGLREFGPQLGLTRISFRLLPLSMKLRTAAALFADSLDEAGDKRVRIEEDENNLFLHIERCPICWGRQSESPACHLAVGILQEALYWISGGKFFDVEETDCIATGKHHCTMVIQKKPLE